MNEFMNKMKQEIASLADVGGFASIVRNYLQNATGGFTRGYNIEFTFVDENLATEFCESLAEHNILAHMMRSPLRVYIKDSESICNLLALAGLAKSLCELSNEIALRSVINTSNRRANCDLSNTNRAIATATAQVEKITALMKTPAFKTLSPELQTTARARIKHPTANYDELARIIGINKSMVVRHLTKLNMTERS